MGQEDRIENIGELVCGVIIAIITFILTSVWTDFLPLREQTAPLMILVNGGLAFLAG